MKVRLPKHREFLIKFADGYEKEDEAWQALNQIVADYSKDGKSVYTPTFIEDNEDKVKALQEQYELPTRLLRNKYAKEESLCSIHRPSGHGVALGSAQNH